MAFTPDYRMMEKVMRNQRPDRLPLYEHIISPLVMETALDHRFAAMGAGHGRDLDEFFRHYCDFFRQMTFDTISFEVCITEIVPDGGAIMGGKPGPIQNRTDFYLYPWDDLPNLYWRQAEEKFASLIKNIPPGMKAVGGVGNGVFEIAEDLVGFEYLCYLLADDPQLVVEIFQKIGNLMVDIWQDFLQKYADHFVACRFGDDLGYKTATMLTPDTIRRFIIPQYQRIIHLVHAHCKPFLFHSCGSIFAVMNDLIAAGIDGKHSNEDTIAPFSRWIERYGKKIALLGGIDVNILFQKEPQEIYEVVVEQGRIYRQQAKGFALGSGNSIPEFIPFERYFALVRAVQDLREKE